MWDIVLPLILMILFYLVPEILKKRRRPEEYKYPEIPDQAPQPRTERVPPPVPPPGRPQESREDRSARPQAPAARTPPADVVLPPAPPERLEPAAAVHRPPEPRPVPVEPTYTPKLPPPVEVPAFAESQPWDGRLDQAAVTNGIIFAEILQPPRAKRPLRPGFGRG